MRLLVDDAQKFLMLCCRYLGLAQGECDAHSRVERTAAKARSSEAENNAARPAGDGAEAVLLLVGLC